jgi:GTPase
MRKAQDERRAPTEDERPVAGHLEARRSGTVAIVGRPNVGKSTLMNAALEQALTIVSATPQTTRESILGVVRRGEAEIALLDTPGLHRAKTALGRSMNRAARGAAEGADVVVFVTDLPRRAPRAPSRGGAPLRPHEGDLVLLSDVARTAPAILCINKVDLLKDKAQLLPLIEALTKAHPFAAVVPVSAKRGRGVDRLLDEIAALCPESEHRFEEDELTDRPTRFFAAEYVREQVLHAASEEVPHATAVTIDSFEETSADLVKIAATLHVERPGQKKILIGKGGEKLKVIGTHARKRIEELCGQRVHLALWVRVTPGWRDSERELAELGYDQASATSRRAPARRKS